MANLPDAILTILAICFPPAVAYIKTGRKDLILNIILTLFVWFPGILHAWYLIVKHPDQRYPRTRGLNEFGSGPITEAQSVVQYNDPPQQPQPQPQPQPQSYRSEPSQVDAKKPPTYEV